MGDNEGEKAGGDVVQHDARAAREPLELPDGRRLEDVEEAEKE